MITIRGESSVYIDVDETLIRFMATPEEIEKYGVLFTYPNGVTRTLVPHSKHIEQLKEHASRLTSVIIWSKAGGAWCELVIKTLGLEQYVDACLKKPDWIFDDLPIEEFMPQSRWLSTPEFELKKK